MVGTWKSSHKAVYPQRTCTVKHTFFLFKLFFYNPFLLILNKNLVICHQAINKSIFFHPSILSTLEHSYKNLYVSLNSAVISSIFCHLEKNYWKKLETNFRSFSFTRSRRQQSDNTFLYTSGFLKTKSF